MSPWCDDFFSLVKNKKSSFKNIELGEILHHSESGLGTVCKEVDSLQS